MSRRSRRRFKPSDAPRWVIDMDEVHPGLYQGSIPPEGKTLHEFGVDALVLMAKEHQPSHREFSRVAVLHAPMDDHPDPLTRQELKQILAAAQFAADRVLHGEVVLVTCAAGINRSGIVSACAVAMLTGCTGREAVMQIKRRRRPALLNRSFVKHVHQLFPRAR